MTAAYDAAYFRFIEQASLESARAVLPVVKALVNPESVVDFGCGTGAWLRAWREVGVSRLLGADGDYVDRQSLLIDEHEFRWVDLSRPVDFGQRFDLASCLEVAEHLPESAAAVLVRTLTRHSKTVLFSAAVPGQGGYRHLNEQPYHYWRTMFAACDYCMLDVLRPRLRHVRNIEPWYAYNAFLFVDRSTVTTLPAALAAGLVPEGAPILDYSSTAFRMRKAVLRALPIGVIDALHKIKKHAVLTMKTLRDPISDLSAGDGRS